MEHTNETKDKSANDNAGEIVAKAGQSRDESPSNREEGQVKRWSSEMVEQKVGRHLAKDVAHEQDRQTQLILRSSQIEVFFEALKTSCCVVVATSVSPV